MKSWRNYLILLLGMLLGVAATLAWKLREEVETVKIELVRVKHTAETESARRTELERDVEEVQGRAKELETELTRARAEVATLVETPLITVDGNMPVTIKEAIVSTDLVRRWINEANNPEYLRRTYAELEPEVQARYAPLFEKLGLNAEQTAQLKNLLINKRQIAVDVAVSSVGHAEDPVKDAAWFETAALATKAAAEEQIKSLLGDESYAIYRAFDRNLAQASTVKMFQESLEAASQSISADQLAKLQRLLNEDEVGVVNPRVIVQAEGFLTPAQRETLEKVWRQQQAEAQRRAERGLPVLPVLPASSAALLADDL